MAPEKRIDDVLARRQPVDELLVQVEQWMSRESFGRWLANHCSDRIPGQSGGVATGAPGVSPQAKASVFWHLYERRETSLIRRFLRRDLDVIEAGGSIGVTARAILRHINRGRCLIVVEPNGKLIPTLADNVGRASPFADSKVLDGALVASDGTSEAVRFLEGADSVLGRASSDSRETELGGVPVRSYSLRDLRSHLKRQRFALVCDIEGGEGPIIGRPLGEFDGCQQLIIELHDSSADRQGERRMLTRLITVHGFRLRGSLGPVYYLDRSPTG